MSVQRVPEAIVPYRVERLLEVDEVQKGGLSSVASAQKDLVQGEYLVDRRPAGAETTLLLRHPFDSLLRVPKGERQ